MRYYIYDWSESEFICVNSEIFYTQIRVYEDFGQEVWNRIYIFGNKRKIDYYTTYGIIAFSIEEVSI